MMMYLENGPKVHINHWAKKKIVWVQKCVYTPKSVVVELNGQYNIIVLFINCIIVIKIVVKNIALNYFILIFLIT